ncbi:hypothetical protein SDC9_134691 [bioreactor metagenome]|uniref:Uncharacterized protein n=1 Tax=bioreactor metagenome TaxID=1076179 RepID=A0A645DEA5_9ZZZZ
MYLVSACLAGINCRYDGKNSIVSEIEELIRNGKAIAICPELLGGLTIPRDSCEIVKASEGNLKVMSKDGKDLTAAFEEGAQKTLKIAQTIGISAAILKSRSPSCGYGKVYDGTFTKTLKDGNGFTASLLAANGITVYTDEEFETTFKGGK